MRREVINKQNWKKIIWDKKEIEDIVCLYKKGWSMKKIGQKYNVSKNPIKKLLTKQNICIRDFRKFQYKDKYSFDDTEKNKIAKFYKDGYSMNKIAILYNVSATIIKKILKDKKIDIRGHRQFNVNNQYFSKINTEDKAYWLGFIAADGYLRHQNYQYLLGINLQYQDVNHLNKLNSNINSNYPVHKRSVNKNGKIYKMACLSINSKQIFDDLNNLGITCNKSHIVSAPKISTDLLRHFWRGVFDGDGTIGCYGKDSQWSLSLYGNKFMLDDFKNFVRNICDAKASILKSKKTHRFSVAGNKIAPKLAHKIYKKSHIYLERKYNKYLQMCKMLNSV